MSNNDDYRANPKNKSVIITDGGSGIGLATARWFAGAYMTDRRPPRLFNQGPAYQRPNGRQIPYPIRGLWRYGLEISNIRHSRKGSFSSPERTLDVAVLAAGISNEARSRMVSSAAEVELRLSSDPAEELAKRTTEVNLVEVYWSAWLALFYFSLELAFCWDRGC
jgi:NAD(P)-dependent dehydrogenase (short-subunit alcohol dehydrogenase family)